MMVPEGCEVVLDRQQLDTWLVLLINGVIVVGVLVVHVASLLHLFVLCSFVFCLLEFW